MGAHRNLAGMVPRVMLPLREKGCDLALHVRAARAPLAWHKGWIPSSFQLYHPAALAPEVTIGAGERAAALHYG